MKRVMQKMLVWLRRGDNERASLLVDGIIAAVGARDRARGARVRGSAQRRRRSRDAGGRGRALPPGAQCDPGIMGERGALAGPRALRDASSDAAGSSEGSCSDVSWRVGQDLKWALAALLAGEHRWSALMSTAQAP